MSIHVVSKVDNRLHATVPVPWRAEEEPPLPPSSIRVRSSLLPLTSNTLNYARNAHVFSWWDTYPIPRTAPTPYTDRAAWGIVPTWGYAVVLESNVPRIAAGSRLFGFLPTSTYPVMLTLEPGELCGHWIEISEHRQVLGPFYNRYVASSEQKVDRERLGWDAVFRILWSSAHLLSEYVFPSNGKEPIQPQSGYLYGCPKWASDDADLSSAAVVILAASTKTARSFAYHLSLRPPTMAPRGILQVTSSPESLPQSTARCPLSYLFRAVTYSNAHLAVPWLVDLQPEKLVIIDFGARREGIAQLSDTIQKDGKLQHCKVVHIRVGYEQKVYTPEELAKLKEEVQKLGSAIFYSIGVQKNAIETEGAQNFHGLLSQRWEHWLDGRDSITSGMHLTWGKGIEGPSGVYGGWEKLAHGAVLPEEGLVYEL
ncbi:hypothetical protein BBP40_006994 [Aspergillus hancockii]|nr:hypothetical protein BBP40_006994 [Aspergillus hancockii]